MKEDIEDMKDELNTTGTDGGVMSVNDVFNVLPIIVIMAPFVYLLSFFVRDKPVDSIQEQLDIMHRQEKTWMRLRRREY